jgi:hypothetical protein
MSVGLNQQRGDELAIYPMKIDVISSVIGKKDVDALVASADAVKLETAELEKGPMSEPFMDKMAGIYLIAGLSAALILLLILLLYSMAARRRAAGKRLTSDERDKLLGDIKKWLNSGEVA